jgi:hypothetical protein
MLRACLWDLRAHAEAHVRQLIETQRLLDGMGSDTAPARPEHRDALIERLHAIRAAHQQLGELVKETIDAAYAVRDQQ